MQISEMNWLINPRIQELSAADLTDPIKLEVWRLDAVEIGDLCGWREDPEGEDQSEPSCWVSQPIRSQVKWVAGQVSFTLHLARLETSSRHKEMSNIQRLAPTPIEFHPELVRCFSSDGIGPECFN